LRAVIDICINNAITGAQERSTYGQTEGERRSVGGPAQASLGQQERHGYWALQVSKTAQTGNLGFDKIMAMYGCEVEIDSEPSAVMAIGTGFSHAH
jgi:hypothetical protein